MTWSVTYPNFIVGAFIYNRYFNQNFLDLVSQGNYHESGTGGIHGVGAGKIVGTALSQTLTSKTISNSTLEDGGGIFNVKMTLTSGSLKFVDRDGNDFSSDSVAGFCMPSVSGGLNKIIRIKHSPELYDSTHTGTKHTSTWSWNIDSSTNYGSDYLFTIYVINKDDTDITSADGTSKLAVSVNPCMVQSPSSFLLLGDWSDASWTQSENSILILGDVTQANYVNLPMKRIGSFRMRYNTSTKWTIQSLSAYADGVSEDALRWRFQQYDPIPTPQFGSARGLLTNTTDGNLYTPAFSSYVAYMNTDEYGFISMEYASTNDGGTDGSTAASIQFCAPTVMRGPTGIYRPVGYTVGATTMTNSSRLTLITGSNNEVYLNYSDNLTCLGAIQAGYYTNGARSMHMLFSYPAYSPIPS